MNATGGASQESDPAGPGVDPAAATSGLAAQAELAEPAALAPAQRAELAPAQREISRDRAAARRVRRLSAEEIASYDLVPAAIAHRAVIVRVPVLLPGALGLTSGRFVLLVRDEPVDGTSVLIAHELVHVRQFTEQGRLRFAAHYVAAYLVNLLRYRRHRTAYLRIPAEQEAFRLSRAWAARHPARS